MGLPLNENPINALQCGRSLKSGTYKVNKAGTQHDKHYYPHFIKIKILIKEKLCLKLYIVANSLNCDSNPSLVIQ